MINRILLCLLKNWRETADLRQHYIRFNAWMQRRRKKSPAYQGIPFEPCAVPEWGICAITARRVLYLFFFLWFRDLTWRQCRHLIAESDSIKTASLFWEAYSQGFRSFKEYDFRQWLRKRDLSRRLALPPGREVLALPEGRESVLEKEIVRIQEESHRGCGLYYEIYEPQVLSALRSLRRSLNGYDLEIFNCLLSGFGWDLSDEYFQASIRAEAELREELYGE